MLPLPHSFDCWTTFETLWGERGPRVVWTNQSHHHVPRRTRCLQTRGSLPALPTRKFHGIALESEFLGDAVVLEPTPVVTLADPTNTNSRRTRRTQSAPELMRRVHSRKRPRRSPRATSERSRRAGVARRSCNLRTVRAEKRSLPKLTTSQCGVIVTVAR